MQGKQNRACIMDSWTAHAGTICVGELDKGGEYARLAKYMAQSQQLRPSTLVVRLSNMAITVGALITESHWAIVTVPTFENAAHAVLSVLGTQLFIRHEY